MRPFHLVRAALFAGLAAGLVAALCAGCAGTPSNPNPHASDELKLASLDLPRYMGRWYNIANVPYFGERDYVGSYSEWKLLDAETIEDLYLGHKGSFDAPLERRQFVDRVVPNSGNAEWRVRVFWPIFISQLTVYVDPDYRFTMLATRDKSLTWIFARTPDISESDYRALVARLDAMGFDTARIRRVPQRPDQIGKPGFQSPGDPH
jgi:apolipoprotein D and lipocalin family protein